MTDLAASIDHTLLKADATRAEIQRLCDEALELGFAAVCVNPIWVAPCAGRLSGSAVRVCAAVGFPLGANRTETKVDEARRAVEQGATEMDVVIQLGLLKSGEDEAVEEDLRAVVEAAGQARVKAILETSLLAHDEIVRAAAHFVESSTGFGSRGATVADVVLLRRTVSPALGVKASGGIRARRDALALLAAGATRLGTSAGVAMVRGIPDQGGDWP